MTSFFNVIHDTIPFVLAGLPAIYAISKMQEVDSRNDELHEEIHEVLMKQNELIGKNYAESQPREQKTEIREVIGEIEIDKETAKSFLTEIKDTLFPELKLIEELKSQVAELSKKYEDSVKSEVIEYVIEEDVEQECDESEDEIEESKSEDDEDEEEEESDDKKKDKKGKKDKKKKDKKSKKYKKDKKKKDKKKK